MDTVTPSDLVAAFKKLYSAPKILVVEDANEDFLLLKTKFDLFGVTLFHASTIEQSIKLLQENNFSVILLDWQLNGEKGIGLLDYLNDSKNPIPVAMYSGFLSQDVIKRVEKYRVITLIPKPPSLGDIAKLLTVFKLS